MITFRKMKSSKRMPLHVAAILLAIGSVFSSSSYSPSICPDGCTCSRNSNSISCQGALMDEVPRSLDQSTTTLDFSKNALTFINTQTFLFLQKLVQLKLSFNDIESIADGSFGSTTSLQTIDLSSNALAEVRNYTFLGADMLLRLDLSDNKLLTVDGAFSTLKELSWLNLCKNRLTQISERTFEGLANLRYILLCDNSIRTIEKNSFASMDKLARIELKNNLLKDLKEFHFTSTFLSYIDLSECWLNYVPRGLPNSIRYLQLRRNNLTSLDGSTFLDCRFISILVLDDNLIFQIENNTFHGMIYLQQLWLNNNQLRRISSKFPSGLQRLFLDSNYLADVPGYVFPPDSGLDTLSLASNQIETLSENCFRNLKFLKKLDLSNNKIARLSNVSFFHTFKLNGLDLSRNPLRHFKKDSFRSLNQLEKLHLSYISTTNPQIDPDAFQGLENVGKLDLDSSSGLVQKIITSDDILSCFPGVRELNLRKSQLTGLRYDFMEFFPNLGHLKISSNRWCCDKALLWLKGWFKTPPAGVNVSLVEDNYCYSPFELRGQSLLKSKFVDYSDYTCHVFTPSFFDDDDDYPGVGLSETTKRQPSDFKPPAVDSEIYDWEGDFEGSPFSSSTTKISATATATALTPTTVQLRLAAFNTNKQTKHYRNSSSNMAATKKPRPLSTIFLPTSKHLAILSDDDGKKASQSARESQTYEASESSATFFILAVILISIIIFIGLLLLLLIVYLVFKSIKARRMESKKLTDSKMAGSSYDESLVYPVQTDVVVNCNTSTDASGQHNALCGQYFLPLKTSKTFGSDGDGRFGKTCSSPSTTSQRVSMKNQSSTLGKKVRESMTLIPGRDINHEGPLKVYKWADF